MTNLSPEEIATGLPTILRADVPQGEAIFESINNHFEKDELYQASSNPIQVATKDGEPMIQDTIGREVKIHVTLQPLRYRCSRIKVVFSAQAISPLCCFILGGILRRL